MTGVLFGVTTIVPVAFTVPQPPVSGMLYINVPDTVGVPLNVIVLPAKAAVIPVGKPVAVPIPVAPVVVWVIAGLSAALIQSVLVALLVTVLSGITVISLESEHKVFASVKVRVTVPPLTPVTTPAFVTVAIAISLLTQVPPVFGVTFAVAPTQTSVAPPKTGAPGMVLIITFVLAAEVQLFALVTVKVYVAPAGKLLIVVLVVLPIVVTLPGDRVIVQLPAGKPLNTTLPPGLAHVGSVISPTTGADGNGFTTTVAVTELPASQPLPVHEYVAR